MTLLGRRSTRHGAESGAGLRPAASTSGSTFSPQNELLENLQKGSRIRAVTPTPCKPRKTAHGSRLTTHGSRESGFSLIEMIVATTVLSLAIVGLLGLIQTSLANAARVREYDRAAMRARSTMSELLVADPLPVPARLPGRYDENSGWEAVVTPFELPRAARIGGVMVVRINLNVWWNADGRRKSVVFDGFRRLRITPDHQEVLP